MYVVSINFPEEILLDLHENEDDFAAYTKCMLAVDFLLGASGWKM